MTWMNEYASKTNFFIRMFVKDLRTGEALIKFVEQLTGEEIPHNDVAANEMSYKQNISALLSYLEDNFGIATEDRWSVNDIYMGNIAAIYCLMVELAHKFECPHDLPSNVTVNLIRREMIKGGDIIQKTIGVKVTEDESSYHELNRARRLEQQIAAEAETNVPEEDAWVSGGEEEVERDAFDELFDEHPDKIDQVETLITAFVNKHLGKLDKQVESLVIDFSNGLNFIFLLGMLGDFFVPIINYNPDPQDDQSKVFNVRVAFKLMDRLEIPRTGLRSAAIVGQDKKTLFRMLYNIFMKYRHVD
eukprot:comp18661_c0_seq2/m.20306 comp18661_c0_seq2/g.20306  ORF comp18661_c0_seq2/g.20306 comp18661_c0_seq2/m.20306 type:complete len:303 (-) comp18661_c0_seq2:320-1228(-)